jgi:hypothetical protein
MESPPNHRCETCWYWLHVVGRDGDCLILEAPVPAFAGDDCIHYEFAGAEMPERAE